jgi:hypothetical protein
MGIKRRTEEEIVEILREAESFAISLCICLFVDVGFFSALIPSLHSRHFDR